jgi:hypothetical protein
MIVVQKRRRNNMRIFGSLTDCECGCDIPKKPSEGGPLTAKKENLVADECCGGTTDECCKEEDEPDTRPGLWARYLERLNKATGGQLPKCH